MAAKPVSVAASVPVRALAARLQSVPVQVLASAPALVLQARRAWQVRPVSPVRRA
ncbi:hypothetical protein [Mycobacterium kubicae]|uniref:hypothetical protein n=1 Tax=Mycobacterium kubicae TaxID=120959 RepID=UPI001F11F7B3|nr:hypothetical protein [Mycobacterium kubicae]